MNEVKKGKKVKKKGIDELKQSCRLPYYGYINVSIDRILDLCMVPNLSQIDDKECEKEVYRKMIYGRDIDDSKISMRRKIYNTYFYIRHMEDEKGKKPFGPAEYFFKYFIPSDYVLDIVWDSTLSSQGDVVERIYWVNTKNKINKVSVLTERFISAYEYGENTKVFKGMDRLAGQIMEIIRLNGIIYLPISYMFDRRKPKGHACLIVLRIIGNKIECYVYDPNCRRIIAVRLLAQFIMNALIRHSLIHEEKKLVYDSSMPISCDYNLCTQAYSNVREKGIGYCAVHVLLHLSLMYMSMPDPTSPNFTLNEIGDCINYNLVTRFSPCQISLLAMMFSLVTTQQYARNKNMAIKEEEEVKRLPLRHNLIKQSEIGNKMVDSFYKWLEHEMTKKKPNYGQLFKYAFNTLRFTKEDWDNAIDIVKERLSVKKEKTK